MMPARLRALTIVSRTSNIPIVSARGNRSTHLVSEIGTVPELDQEINEVMLAHVGVSFAQPLDADDT